MANDFGAIRVDEKTNRMTLSPKIMGMDLGEAGRQKAMVDTENETRKYETVINNIDQKNAALSEFEGLVKDYIKVLEPLRGASEGTTSAGNLAKLIPKASSQLMTGITQGQASQPEDLIDFNEGEGIDPISFTLQVKQIAQLDMSKAVTGFNSSTTALNLTGAITFTPPPSASSSASVPPSVVVSVTADMSLNDLVNSINGQLSGTKVLAGILPVTSTDNRLYFQATATGTPLNVSYSPSLQALGTQLPPDVSSKTSMAGAATATTSLDLSGNIYLGSARTAVTIGPTYSLTGIAANINQLTSSTNIQAQVVQYNTNDFRLMLTTTDGTPLTLDSSPALQVTQLPTSDAAKQNLLSAKLVYQGTDFTRTTNQISDIVPNGTLSLIKADPNTVINVDMVPPTRLLTKNIEDWITTHNKLIDFTQTQTAYDEATGQMKEGTTLKGNVILNQVQKFVRDDLSSFVQGLSSTSGASLLSLGIKVDGNGKMSLDDTQDPVTHQTKLQSMLTQNLSQVQNILSFNCKSSNPDVSVTTHSTRLNDMMAQNGLSVEVSCDNAGVMTATFQVPDTPGINGGLSTPGYTSRCIIDNQGLYLKLTPDPNDPNAANFTNFSISVMTPTAMVNNSSIQANIKVSQGIGDRLLQNMNQVTSAGSGFAAEKEQLAENQKIETKRHENAEIKIRQERDIALEKFNQATKELKKILNIQKQLASFFDNKK
ncbi:MAG: flagellar filament capping protein FliD [Janthinobacterium lividum]